MRLQGDRVMVVIINFVYFLIIISPFVLFRYNRKVNVYYVDTLSVIEIPSLSEICGATKRPWVFERDTVNTQQ